MTWHANATSIHKGAYIQSSDPGAVGAKVLWIDTTSGFVLKKRNDADSGWDTVADLSAIGGIPSTETIQDVVGAMLVDSTTVDFSYDDGAGTATAIVKDGAPPLSPATVTLTDGATITWATAGARQNNARVTLGGNRTLDITGEVDGATGVLIVKQDGTGNRALTLPGSSLVINDGGGAVALSTGANEIDILTWYYDGTNFFWTMGTNYS